MAVWSRLLVARGILVQGWLSLLHVPFDNRARETDWPDQIGPNQIGPVNALSAFRGI
jgi:hypothetical protein